MCDFCKARKEEIERGCDVTCKIFAIDYKRMEKYEYLIFDLKYCPNCGKSFIEENN